jgi:hypothetical protein
MILRSSAGWPNSRGKMLLLALLLTLLFVIAPRMLALTPSSWTKPFPPFRIAGNLYYVGS